MLNEQASDQPFWLTWFNESLEKLKSENSELSEVQLAEKINLPRATLNRLYREKPSKINLETLLKVSLATKNVLELEKALNSYEAGLGTTINQAILGGIQPTDREFTTKELEDKLRSPSLFVTYVLSKADDGISLHVLESILGTEANKAVSELINLELIDEIDGRAVAKNKKSISRSFEHIKHHLSTYAHFYRPEHVGRERNYIQSQTQTLNAEGIKALQSAHRELHQKVRQIVKDQSFRGTIPAFSVSFCDTFTHYKLDNKGDK